MSLSLHMPLMFLAADQLPQIPAWPWKMKQPPQMMRAAAFPDNL